MWNICSCEYTEVAYLPELSPISGSRSVRSSHQLRASKASLDSSILQAAELDDLYAVLGHDDTGDCGVERGVKVGMVGVLSHVSGRKR